MFLWTEEDHAEMLSWVWETLIPRATLFLAVVIVLELLGAQQTYAWVVTAENAPETAVEHVAYLLFRTPIQWY